MARPTILTPELANQIVQNIRAGAYVETAAAAAGIHKETFYAWLRDGAREKRRIEEGKPVPQRNGRTISKAEQERLAMCVTFSDAVNEALAEAEIGDVAVVGRAARGVPRMVVNDLGIEVQDGWIIAPQWQAAAWRLERRNPKRWARTNKHEVSGGDGKPMSVQSDVLLISADKVDEAARRLAEAGINPEGVTNE